jgi:5-methyltetrahydropteroyltriglutamate--homocysteine methyltransferase
MSNSSTASVSVATLGTPRIGPHRELKTALESFWAGKIDEAALVKTAAQLRADNWARQKARGVTVIPSNDFSFYDQVLDTSVLVGAIRRFTAGRAICFAGDVFRDGARCAGR